MLLSLLQVRASSHREAPLIANDPLADNTDLYAFRSPDDPNSVTIIANYIPLQLPAGGPNYYQFGENVRYEIHVDNDVTTPGDDIIYRFTFSKTNEDPTTFFNIRLGQQNLKTTYTLERSMDGGSSFHTIITDGVVPPPNIGPRSIESPVGLGATDYESLMTSAITTANTGEKIFCGPVDDPFFVDLGGIFDLGDAPRQNGTPQDNVACLNVSAIAIQVPIATLQKDGKNVSMAANILDGDYVVGVWASASRPKMRTLGSDSDHYSGPWVQVSRLGMPLTNEAVIPIGAKDEWNARTPYNENPAHFEYFYNPELALYMDDSLFGGAVPGFSPLRIQRNSLGAFDFGNGQDGLFGLKGSPAVAGTALDDAVFGNLLLPAPGKPRSVDLWPAFHTGVPNLEPYQLATGKNGNPLATGKPFVNNFLPNGGDMLRLNMATPATDRNDPAFSSLGLIQAAVLGLTDTTFASTANLEFIPNMDGFPNGRRLEDDVTRIELQAVSGVVLAAIGLWYDDFDGTNPVSQDLIDVLTYTTGVEENDTTFRSSFPYVQTPWSGAGKCGGQPIFYQQPAILDPTAFVCDGGMVSTINGQTQDTVCLNSDELSLMVTNTSSTGADYAYVITDDMDQILGVSMDDSLYFGGATPGNCRVYGVSYTGMLTATPASMINMVAADGCYELSWNYVTVVRGDENDAFCQEAPVLALSYKNSENGNSAAFNKTIKPQLRIEHISGPMVDLADLTVRYWFTQDHPGALTVNCQASDAGCANVNAQLYAMMPVATGADTYLELGFTAGMISMGDKVNTRIRIGRGDNKNFDETDDFSSIGKATNHVNNPNIALYWNGMLIAGNEPMGGMSNSARQLQTVELPKLEGDVYPNPFQDAFFFELAEQPEEAVELRLISMLGQEHFYQVTDAQSAKIQTQELPAGLYFLEVRQGDSRRVYPVMKQ
ncbi:MAG: DUF4331 family protein [Bacteroidota bacterium]